ncbi:TPA: hypothetical protein QDA71_001275 [Burkholderia vietnamiensis]|nr:hypothetical protein [Burkholderia vietnamiensis]HDR9210611.1 hypothetical protein [Burkholderia vietnamiensis]
MKRLIATVERWIGPSSGYPVLSGLLFAAAVAVCVPVVFCAVEWVIYLLPLPGGSK